MVGVLCYLGLVFVVLLLIDCDTRAGVVVLDIHCVVLWLFVLLMLLNKHVVVVDDEYDVVVDGVWVVGVCVCGCCWCSCLLLLCVVSVGVHLCVFVMLYGSVDVVVSLDCVVCDIVLCVMTIMCCIISIIKFILLLC